VVEVTRFRLLPDVDEAEFRAADARYQTDFAYRQPGLVRRTTAISKDGEWIVIDLWRTAGDADGCRRHAVEDPAARAHAAMVDQASVQSARFLELDAQP
jgi:hypothetical protein